MQGEPIKGNSSVGVVLVNWNGAEYTIPCIESLLAGAVKPERIVVVDNASRDNSPELIARAYPEVELIRNKDNSGFTGGNNRGIKRLLAAGCDYIWVLNNDTVVDKNCLSILKEYMDLHPESSACTGKILYAEPKDHIWYAGAVYHKWTMRFQHRGAGRKDNGLYDRIEEVPFMSGCCMFVRRAAIEQIGLFDDHFFAYSEDADWCLRAKKENVRMVYIPQAIIRHRVSATMNQLKSQKTGGTTSPFSVYITSRNRIYMIRKHSRGILQTWTALLAAASWFGYYAIALLFLLRVEKVEALARAVFDGISVSIDSKAEEDFAPRYLP